MATYLTDISAARRGDWVMDERYGLVQVGGWTDAPTPWIYRKKPGTRSLVLCAQLVEDVRIKAEVDVCQAYGVCAVTVWAWRKALGVGPITNGTRALKQARGGPPPWAATKGREKAASAESRAKIAKSKTGQPAHPKTKAALLAAVKKPKPADWGKRANAWMQAAKKQKPSNDLDSNETNLN